MECSKKLAILIPSKVVSQERFSFASISLGSLKLALGALTHQCIVVHDHPFIKKIAPKFLKSLMPQLIWDEKAERFYSDEGVVWVCGPNLGSASALLAAARVALDSGSTYGFIHLDDHIYCRDFGRLLTNGLDSMESESTLQWIRFSGYPIIYKNKADIKISPMDTIEFDRIVLRPIRTDNFTTWVSPLNEEVNNGEYWPIALWFCIYRLDFLIEILEYSISNGARHLADAEVILKSAVGFKWVIDRFPKSTFGYINMQFGGIEMHQNKNWRELLNLSNREIR
jgi:hypothetical protein